MGFIENIEREKQQRLQKELAKQKPVHIQKIEKTILPDMDVIFQENGKIFLEDSKPIIELLQRLNQLGYPDYFQGVARITATNLTPSLYMRNPYLFLFAHEIVNKAEYRFTGPDWFHSIPRYHTYQDAPPSFSGRNIGLAQKVVDARQEIDQRLEESGLFMQYCEDTNNRHGIRPTIMPIWFGGSDFFGDNTGEKDDGNRKYTRRIVSVKDEQAYLKVSPRKVLCLRDRIAEIFSKPASLSSPFPTEQVVNWFTEPHDAGIGFRFKRHLKKNENVRSRWSNGWYIVDTVRENWCEAVYVKINSFGMSTVTGRIQQEVDISDLHFFDDILEDVMKHPAMTYSLYEEHQESPPTLKHFGDFG